MVSSGSSANLIAISALCSSNIINPMKQGDEADFTEKRKVNFNFLYECIKKYENKFILPKWYDKENLHGLQYH